MLNVQLLCFMIVTILYEIMNFMIPLSVQFFYAVNFSRLTGNSLCVFRITQDCLLFAIPVSTLVIKDHHPNRSFVFCTKV